MASGNEDFLFADDFDVIMAILEEDENVEEQFLEAVQEVMYQSNRSFNIPPPRAYPGHLTSLPAREGGI